MDTVPQSETPNDIFSLSDEVLSERLEFIEEVRTALLRVLTPLKRDSCRLVLVIGEVSGYVDLHLPLPQTEP